MAAVRTCTPTTRTLAHAVALVLLLLIGEATSLPNHADCEDSARSAYRAAFGNVERAFAQPCDEDPSSWTNPHKLKHRADAHAVPPDVIEKTRVETGHLFANHSFVFLVGEPFSGTSAMEYFITSASNVRTPCFGERGLWQCEDRVDPHHHRSGSSEEWMLHLRTLARKSWLLDHIPPDGPRILFTKAWHERFFDNIGYTHSFEPLATALSRIGVARDRIFFVVLSRSLFTMHRSGEHSISQKEWRWYAKHNVALINDASLNVLQVKYEDLIDDWRKVRDDIEAFVPGLKIVPENTTARHAGYHNPGKRTAHGILTPTMIKRGNKKRQANVVEFAETHNVNVAPWDWHPNKETARVLEELGYEHGKHWRAAASWGGKATC